jgi:hypothetical protein
VQDNGFEPTGSPRLEGDPVRQPSKKRLEFQGQAATIQQEASRLILRTTELFGWIFATNTWPSGASEDTEALSELGISLADQWRQLEPPRSLEPLWQDLVGQFDDLSRLFDEVAELRDHSGPVLMEKVRALQTAFTGHVELMNQAEMRLLETEVMLRGRAQSGLEDE